MDLLQVILFQEPSLIGGHDCNSLGGKEMSGVRGNHVWSADTAHGAAPNCSRPVMTMIG